MSQHRKMSPCLCLAVFRCKATNAYKLNFKSELDSRLRFAWKGSDFSDVWECGDLRQLPQCWQWPGCLRVRALAVEEITWDFWVWELWLANNKYIGTEWERHKKTYVRTGQTFKWFSFKMKRSDWMRLASGELFVHLPIKEGGTHVSLCWWVTGWELVCV